MSKNRSKNRNELEHYRGKIKALEKLVRQLKSRIKELDRKANFYGDVVETTAESIELENACPECGKGVLQKIDLRYIILEKCQLCGHKTQKKGKK